MNIQAEIDKLDEAIAKATEARETLIKKQKESKRVPKLGDVFSYANGSTSIETHGGFFGLYDSGEYYSSRNESRPYELEGCKYEGTFSDVFVRRDQAYTREQLKEKFSKMKDSVGDSYRDCTKGRGRGPFHINKVEHFIDNLLDDEDCGRGDV